MGKEDSKTKHRSEKLSTPKSSKSKVDKFSKSKQLRHPTTRQCPVIKVKRKSNKSLNDWNILGSWPMTKKNERIQSKDSIAM